jgi:3-oxoacyl-[acyl-carrier protein] reductase
VHIDISGRVTVITGPGRGIGEVLARRFAAEGTRLVLLEREADALERVAADLRGAGHDVEAVVCDVSVEAEVREAVRRAVRRFGTVDILLNNAGVGVPATLEEMSVEQWDETFATNTRGVFLCAREVIPHMKRQGGGRIINAASFASIIPSSPMGAYAASKAAVTSMTRVLAGELGPWNITVNCYAPGMIPTRLSGYSDVTAERRKQLWDTLAFPRWGEPDEIADLLIFLASDQARYITGTMIDVSGGKFCVQFPHLPHAAARAAEPAAEGAAAGAGAR